MQNVKREPGLWNRFCLVLSRVETETPIVSPQSQCFNYQRQNRTGGDWHGLLIEWPPLSKMLIGSGAHLEIDSDSVEHLTIRWSPGDVFHVLPLNKILSCAFAQHFTPWRAARLATHNARKVRIFVHPLLCVQTPWTLIKASLREVLQTDKRAANLQVRNMFLFTKGSFPV